MATPAAGAADAMAPDELLAGLLAGIAPPLSELTSDFGPFPNHLAGVGGRGGAEVVED